MSPLPGRLVATACLPLLFACDRTHMSPSYGVAEREAFRAQIIAPDAGGEKKPGQPLDPEEAAAISKHYQRSISGEKNADPSAGRSHILVVPNAAAGAGMSPAAPPAETK